MNRKTLQLLLHHYQDMHEEMVPCAEKSKFAKLIKETTEQLNKTPFDRIYPEGMSTMEYAIHLASVANKKTKERNESNEKKR